MTDTPPPWTLENERLRAVVADGGALARLAAVGDGSGELELVQHAGSALEPGLLGLWVRDARHGLHPLLGPGSGSRVVAGDHGPLPEGPPASRDRGAGLTVLSMSGEWLDAALAWTVHLQLLPGEAAWVWDVELRTIGTDGAAHEVEIVHAHDVALAPTGMLRANELYVSQYLDLTPLEHPTHGWVIAVRQNLPVPAHPWLVLACTDRASAYATDALDVHGLSARADEPPPLADGLGSHRRQHEHTLAALQTQAHRLAAGEVRRVGFVGLLLADHPAASGTADLAQVDRAIAIARRARADRTSRRGDVDPAFEDGLRPHGPAASREAAAVASVYAPRRPFPVRDLTPAEIADRWGVPGRGVETADDGTLLAFSTGEGAHVVLAAKERRVLRPHGTILRGGAGLAPDPDTVAVTAWMTGSPLSYLTRGHASAGRALTTVRGYLGLHRAYGVRVFVEAGAGTDADGASAGGWLLLDAASAFEMAPGRARWVYTEEGGETVVELTTVLAAGSARLDVRVVAGPPRRFLVAAHIATGEADGAPAPSGALAVDAGDGSAVVAFGPGTPLGDREPGARLAVAVAAGDAAVEVGDDGALFADGVSRGIPALTFVAGTTGSLRVHARIDTGTPLADTVPDTAVADRPARVVVPDLALGRGPDGGPDAGTDAGPEAREVDDLALAIPWLVRDALVHYLAPRGLEQYTGGAWGTRDVSQGPVELLLALDRPDEVRALLERLFGAQNADGTWPQAFGFLPDDSGFRQEPPHGDVVFWPVLALGRYLLTTGDATILDRAVGYAGADRPPESVLDHAMLALDAARARMLPGTHLAAYGHGDWNDSLQPAQPGMADTLTSTWTVTLHHHTLRTLAEGLADAGVRPELVTSLLQEASAVAGDARRHLMPDGELAGYVQLAPPVSDADADDDGGTHASPRVTRVLVHPSDTETGLRHSALPMIHAIAEDFFTPDEATRHVAILSEHLQGADGMRLFDRPARYSGGPMEHFQRAESASFVGREIGLMYVHAHLRWCEALARLGDAAGLWLALRRVTGGGVARAVPGARPRQTNAYFSSSDAAVADRAEFAARYDEIRRGEVAVEGGWRIYSSGPGITVRILSEVLLGVRRRGSGVELDPVLPASLDGLVARVPLAGGALRVRYRVGGRGYGPSRVLLGGRELRTEPLVNPYREGGVRVPIAMVRDAVAADPGGEPRETLEIVLP